jgi:hypothetical protein
MALSRFMLSAVCGTAVALATPRGGSGGHDLQRLCEWTRILCDIHAGKIRRHSARCTARRLGGDC